MDKSTFSDMIKKGDLSMNVIKGYSCNCRICHTGKRGWLGGDGVFCPPSSVFSMLKLWFIELFDTVDGRATMVIKAVFTPDVSQPKIWIAVISDAYDEEYKTKSIRR